MLRALQRLLETIYDAPCGQDVEHFLLTRRADLPAERREQASDEELLLVDAGHEAGVGLYIDGAVLGRLAHHSPLRRLDEGNIADFWTALEGVSHFSYLTWNLAWHRGVSQLELELQGEVDKYIASWWLLRAQNPGHVPRELRPLLFSRTVVDARLEPSRRQLYAAASRYAERFCTRLEHRLASDQPSLRRSATPWLRRFYRLGSTRKLQHIEALA